jgi:hypothetical protein
LKENGNHSEQLNINGERMKKMVECFLVRQDIRTYTARQGLSVMLSKAKHLQSEASAKRSICAVKHLEAQRSICFNCIN